MPCEAQDKPVHGSGQKSAVVLRTQLTASEGGPYSCNTKKDPNKGWASALEMRAEALLKVTTRTSRGTTNFGTRRTRRKRDLRRDVERESDAAAG